MLVLSLNPSNGFQWLLTHIIAHNVLLKYYYIPVINLLFFPLLTLLQTRISLGVPWRCQAHFCHYDLCTLLFPLKLFFLQIQIIYVAWSFTSFKSYPNTILFKIANPYPTIHYLSLLHALFFFLTLTYIRYTIYFTDISCLSSLLFTVYPQHLQ